MLWLRGRCKIMHLYHNQSEFDNVETYYFYFQNRWAEMSLGIFDFFCYILSIYTRLAGFGGVA